jgi:hypothetical protein
VRSQVFIAFFGLLLCRPWIAGADPRDEEIFGEAASNNRDAGRVEPAPPAEPPMTLGGRLELEYSTRHQKGGDPANPQLSRQATADLSIEGKPNPDWRGMLGIRLVDPVAPGADASEKLLVDEASVRWDAWRTIFFTVGRQHLRWGAGRFWNPTDFLASSIKDPFASFDRRLGVDLVKLHIPQEKQGFNHYLIARFEDSTASLQQHMYALRSEFAVFGQGEISFTYAGQSRGRNRIGMDVSAGVGPLDVYAEAAFISNRLVTQYEGSLDLNSGTLPRPKSLDQDGFIQQSVAGISWSFKYGDDDSATVGGEYFLNGNGYEDPGLELYSFMTGANPQLYLGRRYAALYARIPKPFSFNRTSLMVTALSNLSDESVSQRYSLSYDLGIGTSVEWYASACHGDPGELCFAAPAGLKAAAEQSPAFSSFRAGIAAMPEKPLSFQSGVVLRVAF